MSARRDAVDAHADDRQFVVALARGLALLRAYRPGENDLSNSELAQRTGLPRPTITRFVYTLTQLGYLESTDRGYRLSPAVLMLGYPVLAGMSVREIAGRHMQSLANHASGTSALGTRIGNEMVFIHRCIGPAAVGLRLEIGSAIPIATTAMGRAWLAGTSEEDRESVLDDLPRQYGHAARRIKAEIAESLALYRERGFCISLGGWYADVSAVGVPLQLPRMQQVLAFNCGGPSYRLTKQLLMHDLGPRLVALAAEVRAALEVTGRQK